jgi:hypothetical protein
MHRSPSSKFALLPVPAHKFQMVAIVLQAVLCAVTTGILYFGWFLATVNRPPKQQHSALKLTT